MSTIKVVVADDQAAVREGLITMLGLDPDIEVIGAARNGHEVVTLVTELAPDVVLMDLHMPDVDGLEATRRIIAHDPAAKVVVLTTFADDSSVLEALRAGALGYLTKDAGRLDILRALQSATAGHALLDACVHARIVSLATEPTAGEPLRPVSDDPGAANGQVQSLTAREGEVLRLIACGLSNAEIARELVLSENTVKSHVNHLFAKIGAADRAQAVIFAFQHGYTDGGTQRT